MVRRNRAILIATAATRFVEAVSMLAGFVIWKYSCDESTTVRQAKYLNVISASADLEPRPASVPSRRGMQWMKLTTMAVEVMAMYWFSRRSTIG